MTSAGDRFVPARLGRYEIIERLAAGGMGEVFVGRLSGTGGFVKPVAVKRIHPAFCEDPQFVDMLHDEANLSAAVKHPNIIPTIDVGLDAGHHFVVMEFVSGSSLSKLLSVAKGRGVSFPGWVVAWVGARIASALHAVHEAKDLYGAPLAMVHRDVSPQNVMLSNTGHPMLFDFGIAKATRRIAMTEQGVLKGKLQYMAPELLSGEPVHRSIDIFALGIVMYELLTGVSPYRGETDLDTLSALQSPVAPPRSLVSVDPALEAIVLWAMDRERVKRPPTADHLERALDDWAQGRGLPYDSSAVAGWIGANFAERVAAGLALLARVAEAEAVPLAATDGDTKPAAGGSIGTVGGVSRSAVDGPGLVRQRRMGAAIVLGLAAFSAIVVVTAVVARRPSAPAGHDGERAGAPATPLPTAVTMGGDPPYPPARPAAPTGAPTAEATVSASAAPAASATAEAPNESSSVAPHAPPSSSPSLPRGKLPRAASTSGRSDRLKRAYEP